MDEIMGFIEVDSEVSVPIWSVNHFMDYTTRNYLKIVTLREMFKSLGEGAEVEDFFICEYSYEIFPETSYMQDTEIVTTSVISEIFEEKKYIQLGNVDKRLERFWYLFHRLHRPIVMVRHANDYSPIYRVDSRKSLKIRSLSLLSPVNISLQGVVGALIDLFSGHIMTQRENERNSQAISNIRNAIETSHLIDDVRTPLEIKRLASEQLRNILIKQEHINRKLGIKSARIGLLENEKRNNI